MAYTTIDDPSAYFQTLLYTGNDADNRNLTNNANAGDFQPDWLWFKERSSTSSHQLHDSTRGTSFAVMSDSTAVEDEDANRLQAIQSNGFQVGSASTVNQNTITMVAWQWKCNGGTTTTNDASSTGVGSIDSVIQANTDAGFSIVTYTGTGSAGTIAHGLGGTPDFILFKNRGANVQWSVYYGDPTDYLVLDKTDTTADNSNRFNDTSPTSTVFSVGGTNNVNADSNTYVAYCFAPIKGYSKFGTYEGNANANGAFVYTGFKPAWLMVKNIDSANVWQIYDNKREPNNPNIKRINANVSEAESTSGSDRLDFLSNGFKMRATSGNINSAHTYIYMAFAESPFVSSKGTPTTAR